MTSDLRAILRRSPSVAFVSRLGAIVLLAFTIAGCEALRELTDPEPPTTRALTLSASPENLPPEGGEVTITATVLAGAAPEIGVTVRFSASGGEFLDGESAQTDGGGNARVRMRLTRSVEVSASVNAGGVTLASAEPLTVAVGSDVVPTGKITFEVQVDPKPAEIGKPVKLTITAKDDGGQAAAGKLDVEFGDGKRTRIPEFKRKATVTHTYREISIFNLTISLTDEAGTVSRDTMPLKVVDGAETGIVLEPSTFEIPAREVVEFQIRLSRDDGKRGTGRVHLNWDDGRSISIGDVSGSHTIEHMFRDKGSYRVTAAVDAPNGKSASTAVRIRVFESVSVSGALSAQPQRLEVDNPVTFTFTARRSGGDPGDQANGTVKLRPADGTGVVQLNLRNGVATYKHTYENPGAYVVSADFDDGEGHRAQGNVRVRVDPEPVVGGGGGGGGGGGDDGGGGGGGGGADQIDAGSLKYLHANVSNWNVTSETTSVTVSSSEICIRHTKAGRWPVSGSLEGNPWIVVNIGGTWYAATYEWLRPGQICKALGVPKDYPSIARALGPHIKQPPLSSWVPRSGETVYFFVSTHARTGTRTSNERSNMVKVIWP